MLTEEFVTGIKISDVAALEAAGLDRTALGRTFVRALIKQVLVDGFFHGDPHPGNVLVDPATGRIIFIDLGMVGLLTSQQRLDLLDLIFSLTARDFEGVATTLIGLSKKTKAFDEPTFRRAIDQVLRRYLDVRRARLACHRPQCRHVGRLRQRAAPQQPADARHQGADAGRGNGRARCHRTSTWPPRRWRSRGPRCSTA